MSKSNPKSSPKLNLSLQKPVAYSDQIAVKFLKEAPRQYMDNSPEGADFQNAILNSKIADFEFGYLQLSRGGETVTTLGYFTTKFNLGTSIKSRFASKILSLIQFNIVCVGHPVSDFGYIQGEVSPEILEAAVQALRKFSNIVVFKGFSENLPVSNFTQAKALPGTILSISTDYWIQLKSHRRNTLLKHLKRTSSLKMLESVGLPAEYHERVFELYEQVRKRSQLQFVHLNRSYFSKSSEISRYLLFFEGDLLIGFIQIFIHGKGASACFLGQDYKNASKYQLYFSMLLSAINLAIREGCESFDFGSTSYTFKGILGCKIIPLSIYYQHSNPIFQWILAKVHFLFEPSEADLK